MANKKVGATIGLKDLYYAPITEDADGNETYGTPVKLAPAISAALSINYQEGSLNADDSLEDSVREFASGALSLNVSAIGASVAAALTGATLDKNGVLISADTDDAPPVAIGFKAKTSKGTYRYVWLYRVKFSTPNENYQTKGDSVTFNTPTIEGTIHKRNKPLANDDDASPWKATVVEGESDTSATAIAGWFTNVYEPSFAD